MLSRILRTIREHDLLAAGDRVLVAVSGGPDSTALLHALARLSPRLGVDVAVACVDHGLRPESAEEARAVSLRCQCLKISCEVIDVDVRQARRAHVSLQEAARNVRLAALEAAAARLGCMKIALGHTADDQAETVLFRIVRGTGIAGLAGIPYRRGPFIRPLLDVRRSELLGYLAKRKVEFFSDPSNANRRYARSRIRHDVLPLLEHENPRVVESLLALAREARAKGRAMAWRASLPPGLFLPRRVVESVERLVRDGRGSRRIAVRNGEITVTYGKVAWRPVAPSPSDDKIRERSKIFWGRARTACSTRPRPLLKSHLPPLSSDLAENPLALTRTRFAGRSNSPPATWRSHVATWRPGYAQTFRSAHRREDFETAKSKAFCPLRRQRRDFVRSWPAAVASGMSRRRYD